MLLKFKKMIKSEKGQGMVEVGLVLALVSVVAMSSLGHLGGRVNNTFGKVDMALGMNGETELPDVDEGQPVTPARIITAGDVDPVLKTLGRIGIFRDYNIKNNTVTKIREKEEKEKEKAEKEIKLKY